MPKVAMVTKIVFVRFTQAHIERRKVMLVCEMPWRIGNFLVSRGFHQDPEDTGHFLKILGHSKIHIILTSILVQPLSELVLHFEK